MAKADDFAFLDATAQAEMVRRKKVKAIELVDAAIERIERLNPALNAVVTPMYEHARAAQFMPFTPVCNLTGQPAMSVPLFWNLDGLPVGSHFIGRFGDEATLFRLAAQLEASRPWAGRRLLVSA